MVNYEVDPSVLQGFVPRGVELDYYHGRTFVSMVGFLFLSTRVFGMRFPFHTDFEEVNLRFYVRQPQPDGTFRRGVVFVREIVPRLAIATIARLWYNEPYVARPMRHQIERTPQGITTRFEWKYGGRWNRLAASVANSEPTPMEPGSIEEFITEHYWGYTAQRGGSTLVYQVEHPRWRVWTPATYEFDCDVGRLYGEEFVPVLSAPAVSAFIAEGAPVSIRRGDKIER